MKFSENETANKILTWFCMGFVAVAAAGVGAWQLAARSVDFLKPLGW